MSVPSPFWSKTNGCPAPWLLRRSQKRYPLFFQSRKDRTIGTGQISGRRGINLGFGISWSTPNPPGNLQAGPSSPSALQRLTVNEFVSIQPRLGIRIRHQSLPENLTILFASIVKRPQHKKKKTQKGSVSIIETDTTKSRNFVWRLLSHTHTRAEPECGPNRYRGLS